MKKFFKAINVAFSIYSKIPMPRFNWESEDMQYHLCFFPWVGAVIGGLELLWYWLSTQIMIGVILYYLFAVAIPLLITGGFHIDGFMDTMDAIHSYADREKKLEILKDPHIGAFSVICLLTYMLVAIGFLSQIYMLVTIGALSKVGDYQVVGIVCCSFFLSRVMSGISVVTMNSAKKKGMLQTFSSTAAKRTVLGSLIVQGILCGVFMIILNWYMGLAAVAAVGLTYLYYWRMSKKQFGGITGDLAGFFVSVAELMVVVVIGIICTLIK